MGLAKQQVADQNVMKANRVWRHIYKMAVQIHFILLKQIFHAYIKLRGEICLNQIPFRKKCSEYIYISIEPSLRSETKESKPSATSRKKWRVARSFWLWRKKFTFCLFCQSLLGDETSDTRNANGKDMWDHRTITLLCMNGGARWWWKGVLFSKMRCILSTKGPNLIPN